MPAVELILIAIAYFVIIYRPRNRYSVWEITVCLDYLSHFVANLFSLRNNVFNETVTYAFA